VNIQAPHSENQFYHSAAGTVYDSRVRPILMQVAISGGRICWASLTAASCWLKSDGPGRV